MFVYLSKKIAIPNNFRLNCIAWNQKEGYIAVGGEDGLLKVLRVESVMGINNMNGKSRNLTAASNLSMNQTLEGHNGHVQVVTWNEEHQKLTSSDQNGVIIVWMMYKGSWYEEMINNRNKSVVKSMSWSQDGQKICIVYEDGAVIVGSVDGNRIWGKELKNVSLCSVQWSPDGKLLLFGLKNGELHLYDNQGIFLTKLNMIQQIPGQLQTIVTLQWYNGRNGYIAMDCPTLAICYQSGKILLIKDTNDDNPVVIETGMTTAWCCWNCHGSILAVTGMMPFLTNGETKDVNAIQFYTQFGEHIRTLKIPGREVTACAWEGGSLRVALSVDSHIYFANIRPDYKWTYFSNTVVFTNEKISKDGICITFWNTSNNTCCTKFVRTLISIASCEEHCVLAVKNDLMQGSEQFALLVCNTIATPIDTKFLDMEPLYVTITSNIVIAASKNNFILWTFRTPRNSALLAGKLRKEKIYHVDDTPTGVTEVIQDLDRDRSFESPTSTKPTMDPISCICATEKLFLIGRESGMIQRYSLPQVTLMNRYNASCKLYKMAINCDSTRISIMDTSGVLTMLDLDIHKGTDSMNTKTGDDVSKFERKDVWGMCWAQDNPLLLAIMEKTRMYVLRGLDPEEPISCYGYICFFQDLEIRCVLLDDLIEKPDEIKNDLIIDLEVKSLRDTRELLAKVGLKEANNFIQDNPHPRLWRLLAESALKVLDLETAENAMVRCTDYLGIQFIKRLRNVHNDQLKKAEVAAFLGNYDEAEKLYLDMDRRDLAITLRQKLGDYFRVVQLMKMGIGGSDKQMEHAFNKIGDSFAERQNWEGAREYYEKGRNLEKLIQCYYKLEDFIQLAGTVDQLPDKSPILKTVAKMLSSVGMCSQAVTAYIKYGDVKLAVDTCVRLNHWDQAIDLAKTYKMAQIGELLNKYANHLLTNGKRLQAIELYKKANYYLEAAKLLIQLAEEQAKFRTNPLRVKKIYVLAALLIEDHINSIPTIKGGRSNVVMGLMESNEDTKIIENAWRGAEAYHFLLLAHRQIYDCNFDASMKTALRLREYEDILELEDIYCLLALSSAVNHAFATCSKAFIKLEAFETIPESKREEYEELAVNIFTKHNPKDTRNVKAECVNCETLIPDWCVICPNCMTRFPACIVSGKPLMDLSNAWTCTVCRHHVATERDVVNINACPLCHSTITYM
ncbi:PREDICTED: WD repeat-containing protein 35 [Polistes canadensis]|uniref:WD repeat-containing protein 35 n=1 Tax=Polistes canadensis TaxID=91411 RepID=UPI000718FFE6|nr:PREDICTED: WD repeat-containing protein 35 [Polistes canadensis]XP_014602694.1 PREDICTED: WD repeat-containing protein 35 [Polistes canadensis]